MRQERKLAKFYKKRKKIKEGVTLELEGNSVLIESFVLKEEAIKKSKRLSLHN